MATFISRFKVFKVKDKQIYKNLKVYNIIFLLLNLSFFTLEIIKNYLNHSFGPNPIDNQVKSIMNISKINNVYIEFFTFTLVIFFTIYTLYSFRRDKNSIKLFFLNNLILISLNFSIAFLMSNFLFIPIENLIQQFYIPIEILSLSYIYFLLKN